MQIVVGPVKQAAQSRCSLWQASQNTCWRWGSEQRASSHSSMWFYFSSVWAQWWIFWSTREPQTERGTDWKCVNTKTDYQRLRKALIKEFADPESDQGLVAALETRQGRHEPPQAYYSRLRQAYFGTRNDSDMEDEPNFKTLFLRNLHPGISHHLGVLACPRTMNTQQLRDLVQKAYYKQKMASEKSAKTPAVLDFNTQHHELALEGTQRQDSAKPPHKEWNAPPSNRGRDSHAGTRPKQRYDRWDEPRGRQRSPGRHWDKSWDQAGPHENQWEKEEEPESAWLAVGRNGSDKLNKSATGNSIASPHSQRTVNTRTSDQGSLLFVTYTIIQGIISSEMLVRTGPVRSMESAKKLK